MRNPQVYVTDPNSWAGSRIVPATYEAGFVLIPSSTIPADIDVYLPSSGLDFSNTRPDKPGSVTKETLIGTLRLGAKGKYVIGGIYYDPWKAPISGGLDYYAQKGLISSPSKSDQDRMWKDYPTKLAAAKAISSLVTRLTGRRVKNPGWRFVRDLGDDTHLFLKKGEHGMPDSYYRVKVKSGPASGQKLSAETAKAYLGNPIPESEYQSEARLKKALKGLSTDQLEELTRLGDTMYLAGLREGFGHSQSRETANNIVAERARGMKAKKGREMRASEGKLNPGSVTDLSEEFHGRPPGSVTTILEAEKYRKDLAVLGRLVSLSVLVGKNKVQDIRFKNGTQLASAKTGNQYFIVGGDQSIDLSAFNIKGAAANKDLIDLGEAYSVVYHTDKHHLAGPSYQKDGTEYEHKFGEKGGQRPILVYDTLNQRLALVGGTYETRAEGIIH